MGKLFFFGTIQKAYIGRYKRIRYNLDIMRHTARLVVNPITVKIIGYNLDIMRQTACLVVNPITIDSFALLLNCTMAVQASDSMTVSS